MLPSSRTTVLAAAVGGAVIAAFLAGLAQSERTIERSFATALEQRPAVRTAPPIGDGFDPAFLHLTSLPVAVPHAVRGAVHVGERISWSSATGEAEIYEVVDVRPLHAGTPGPAGGLVLVTAAGIGAAAPAALRLVIEVRPRLVPPVPVTPRAL